jgi:reactive intermediate/imine deaminase
MSRSIISTDQAPKAIGTYSQAVRTRDALYVSGQIPLDPATGNLVEGGMEAQIRRSFDNLKAIVEAAGAKLADAVKVNIYVTDLAHFALVNQIMAQYFSEPYPARAAVQVSALPKGAHFEVDCVVAVGGT